MPKSCYSLHRATTAGRVELNFLREPLEGCSLPSRQSWLWAEAADLWVSVSWSWAQPAGSPNRRGQPGLVIRVLGKRHNMAWDMRVTKWLLKGPHGKAKIWPAYRIYLCFGSD